MKMGERVTLPSGATPYCVCAAFGRLLCAATANACELNLDQSTCANRAECCFVTLGGGLCLSSSHPQCKGGSGAGPASTDPNGSGTVGIGSPETIDGGASSLGLSTLLVLAAAAAATATVL
jgi:hypothetical protein